MPRKSLKNRKLSPWVTEAVEHWRWVEDQLHPLPKVTEPEDTAMWEEQLLAESVGIAERKRAEDRYIERMRRIERNRIIDKMLAEANQYAQRQHERRQRIMEV